MEVWKGATMVLAAVLFRRDYWRKADMIRMEYSL